jgi:hypothetical protein
MGQAEKLWKILKESAVRVKLPLKFGEKFFIIGLRNQISVVEKSDILEVELFTNKGNVRFSFE